MIHLIFVIAIFGFLCWVILQIPMPKVFHNVILGLMCLVLVLYVLQMLGVHTGLPRMRLD